MWQICRLNQIFHKQVNQCSLGNSFILLLSARMCDSSEYQTDGNFQHCWKLPTEESYLITFSKVPCFYKCIPCHYRIVSGYTFEVFKTTDMIIIITSDCRLICIYKQFSFHFLYFILTVVWNVLLLFRLKAYLSFTHTP